MGPNKKRPPGPYLSRGPRGGWSAGLGPSLSSPLRRWKIWAEWGEEVNEEGERRSEEQKTRLKVVSGHLERLIEEKKEK